jgi:outer membrane protein TolC
VGFSVPLLDWGVNRSNRKRAEANLSLEINNIAQEQTAMEQDIYYRVMQWNMHQEQMNIAEEANDLAQKLYNISKEKYAAGSMRYTDFNNAQQEKDRAAIDYLNNLHIYWSLYFTIRKITLFDFENSRNITSLNTSHVR